jgi:hypothetical protein
LFETRRSIGDAEVLPLVANKVEHCCLKAGKAEVERVSAEALGQLVALRVTALCSVLDGGAAGIAEAERSRRFIKGFSCCVVDCATKSPIVAHRSYFDQFGVATGD